jgi:group I intron endonuclease
MAKISEKNYSVYIIRCIANGKVYVGLTSGLAITRFARHKREAKSGSECLIHRAMRKHGFNNFTIEVIADGLSCEEACNLERMEIKKRNADSSGGYNILEGGQSGVSARPKMTRARKSAAAKAAWITSDKWKAAIHAPARLEAISKASKKMFENPEYRLQFEARHADMVARSMTPSARLRATETFKKNGHCVSVGCSNGMVFDSASDAANWLKNQTGKLAHISNILNCAKGRKKTAYGYTWHLVGKQ